MWANRRLHRLVGRRLRRFIPACNNLANVTTLPLYAATAHHDGARRVVALEDLLPYAVRRRHPRLVLAPCTQACLAAPLAYCCIYTLRGN